MIAAIEITAWHYAGFLTLVVLFLAFDLGVFHKKARVVSFKEALIWTGVWFSVAMIFAAGIEHYRTKQEAIEFITGYIIELSLSMDNVFVIALIFAYFKVPSHLQHRVLYWGILGALVMRGLMIGGGSALVQSYKWTLYIFGAFLIYSGIKMIFADEEGVEPERNPVIQLARRCFPVSSQFEEQKFFTRVDGRFALTPLALVLLMVETTDLIFAVDSIPAIFAVTTNTFIIFTSNVFAILGLRSLYFVLAGAIEYFRYLKIGLSLVLIFIGGKMLLPLINDRWHVSSNVSLIVVVLIIILSMVFSIASAARELHRPRKNSKDKPEKPAEKKESETPADKNEPEKKADKKSETSGPGKRP